MKRKLTTTQELEVVELYKDETQTVGDIKTSYNLDGTYFYNLLRKHNVELRGRGRRSDLTNHHSNGSGNGKHALPPAKPAREWYLLDECAVIVGMETADIEWLIHKGAVHADVGKTATGGTFTLVYLPSLVDAQAHAGIDGKRAKQLLQEAWTMLEKVSRQRAINLEDAKFITTAIRDFFVLNGWNLG